MKLLASSGLLYNIVAGQTADGHFGAFAQIDWAVTIKESATSVTTSSTSANTPTPAIGWDPSVMGLISTYDGGKVMAGYGWQTGTLTAGWVLKMFGTVGTTTCVDSSATTPVYYTKPVGWVTMTTQPMSTLAAESECLTETQWTYGSLTNDNYSELFTSIMENYSVSTTAPLYYLGGGMSAKKTFGLGSWNVYATALTTDGYLSAGLTGATAYGEEVHMWFDTLKGTNYAGLAVFKYATSGFYTAVHDGYSSGTWIAAGTIASAQTCLDFAIDGYVITGVAIGYYFATKTFTVTTSAPVVNNAIEAPSANFADVGGHTNAGANWGCLIQVLVCPSSKDVYMLGTSNEYYGNSYIVALETLDWDKGANASYPITTADSGRIQYAYGYKEVQSTTDLVTGAWDRMILVGGGFGKGRITPGKIALTQIFTVKTDMFSTPGHDGGRVYLTPPTGGVAQFKGLAQGTVQAKFVEMQCNGIQPMFYTTAWQALSSGLGNGFMVTCLTGIAQCHASVANAAPLTPLVADEMAACLADPRYLTWRMVTTRILYIGTVVWSRTDSYWDSSATQLASTWGPGLKLSSHEASAADNNGATAALHVGKTFVYAFTDGSGVQLNHLSYDTGAPTTYTTGGKGLNYLTTAPTSYTNATPNLYRENYCLSSSLLLQGTTDTSALDATITLWSDGYTATTTVALELVLGGAAGGWRGVCMVYYSAQYTQTGTDGAVCHAVQASTQAGAGPTDYGASYLMHIPTSSWAPPAATGSVTPSGLALSDTKYDLVYEPAAAVAYLLTAGYYASATWYQPKAASEYTALARYGKDDFVGVYCFTGAGSTSHFQVPSAAIKLTGAVAIAATVLAVGTAISLAI